MMATAARPISASTETEIATLQGSTARRMAAVQWPSVSPTSLPQGICSLQVKGGAVMFLRWQHRVPKPLRQPVAVSPSPSTEDLALEAAAAASAATSARRKARPRSNEPTLVAVLAESHRVDGRPRQRLLRYVGSIRLSAIATASGRARFWDRAANRLADLPQEVRGRFERALEARVSRPTRAELMAGQSQQGEPVNENETIQAPDTDTTEPARRDIRTRAAGIVDTHGSRLSAGRRRALTEAIARALEEQAADLAGVVGLVVAAEVKTLTTQVGQLERLKRVLKGIGPRTTPARGRCPGCGALIGDERHREFTMPDGSPRVNCPDPFARFRLEKPGT